MEVSGLGMFVFNFCHRSDNCSFVGKADVFAKAGIKFSSVRNLQLIIMFLNKMESS